MAKVRIKKKVVKEFLDRVCEKAVTAVVEKYDAMAEDAFTRDAESLPPNVRSALLVFIDSINAMYAAAHKLQGLTADIGCVAERGGVPSIDADKPFYYVRRYGYTYGDFIDELSGIRLNLPRAIVTLDLLRERGYTLFGGELERLYVERLASINEVRLNYGRLHKLVTDAKNGNVAMEKLEELGFDCTWIRNNNCVEDEEKVKKEEELEKGFDSINKEALFPCGDNK